MTLCNITIRSHIYLHWYDTLPDINFSQMGSTVGLRTRHKRQKKAMELCKRKTWPRPWLPLGCPLGLQFRPRAKARQWFDDGARRAKSPIHHGIDVLYRSSMCLSKMPVAGTVAFSSLAVPSPTIPPSVLSVCRACLVQEDSMHHNGHVRRANQAYCRPTQHLGFNGVSRVFRCARMPRSIDR